MAVGPGGRNFRGRRGHMVLLRCLEQPGRWASTGSQQSQGCPGTAEAVFFLSLGSGRGRVFPGVAGR